MNKKKFNTAWSFGLLLLSGLGLTACNNQEGQRQMAPGQMAVPVTLTAVTEEVVTGYKQYPANVVPLRETELRAEVSGYVTGIFVADGASVSAGQKLYEIDQTRYGAALEQAKASMSIAKANKDRVERDLVRYETLAAQDAIARQVLDNTRTELQTAEAQLMAAQAALTTAQTNLERSVIRAPFAGIIGISQVRNGALVTAGQTLLNTMSSIDPISVEFNVNENDLAEVIALQRNTSAKADSVITLELSDGRTYPFTGAVTTLDRAVNRNTGTITARATFDNTNGLLRPGMSAILRIRLRADDKQLVIPYKAISEQLGQTTVYVLADSNRVEQRVIRLGMKSGEKAVVQEGLDLGDQVVTEGMINLRHGALIRASETSENGQ